MDWHLVLFSTIGGLGLFIYGMTIMSDSLKRIAGERMKSILAAVSTNRVVACLTGVGVTAVIQSSSATTVMLVGFANAGLMTTTQAVGVALGAHVGTTVTAQLLAFNVSELALPGIALGSLLRVFSSNRNLKEIGGFILGLSLLFYGMDLMKAGVSPFKESSVMVDFFTRFDASSFSGIILCVLVGAVCTMIVQSSSVTVGLTMALASQGLLTLPGAMALVLGDNIGTTITAELAALKTDLAARRMARTNSISNVLGATYMVILFPFYIDLVVWFTQTFAGLGPAELVVDGAKPNISRYVANAHTIFNVVNAIVMVSALPLLVKVGTALTPRGKELDHGNLMTPLYLDEGSLKTTTVALSQSRKEIVRMSEISQSMAAQVFPALISRKHKDLGPHEVKEEALDSLQRAIHRYLVQLYGDQNSQEEQSIITAQMTIVNGIERVGDTTTHIANLIGYAIDHNVYLSDEAMADYRNISATALEFHELVTSAMRENRTDILDRAEELEQQLDVMRATMRDGHLDRLKGGHCGVDQGLVFSDMLNYFERLGDYLLKISKAWVNLAATGL
ncbi:transporter [Deltaproteobacteria bacterium Smac51]|nr:transporter [Deltaproteobacteria bacterium Smac51]